MKWTIHSYLKCSLETGCEVKTSSHDKQGSLLVQLLGDLQDLLVQLQHLPD